jgi:energy-coupling factor transporter ATP-binding protein EcfA2
MLRALLDDPPPGTIGRPRSATSPVVEEIVARWGANVATVPRFECTAANLMNKSIIFYGGSGSGKTTMMRHFMWVIQKMYPLVSVYSTTNREQKTFDGCVPKYVIRDKILAKGLEDMFLQQKMRTQIYELASDSEKITTLFNAVADANEKHLLTMFEQIRARVLQKIDMVEGISGDGKKQTFSTMMDQKIMDVMKAVITKNIARVTKMRLTKEQMLIVKYLNMNPNILVVFDDMTEDLTVFGKECERLAKKEADPAKNLLSQFFTKGRWAKISHWYALHAITKSMPNICRDNAHIVVLLTESIAMDFLKELEVTGVRKKEYAAIIQATFKHKHTKVIYDRNEGKFYCFKADLHRNGDIKIGSQALWDLEKRICPTTSEALDKDNPFYKKFVA